MGVIVGFEPAMNKLGPVDSFRWPKLVLVMSTVGSIKGKVGAVTAQLGQICRPKKFGRGQI
ncbi:hypothetical protein FC50_GL000692 [Lacticaseibacillus pantheris DSM 15945 = JCM 12539 = NBRC 106106]|uniref:Uncharacterized protein n=1 Tax=Lacticaseibacillus pantheris DSM 15945 = JCM 12539 = NBRC 106106 TaxID=1423783 RepID=A0A0R1TYZ9_9LACO|nr:hypothetical protein FC50_GL000692 [Lacticaseibacillus pantheris DSM 15945 = JCM 12539 = NBRC 106106]